MPSIMTNKTNIFYTDDGEGKPLVFIHGLGADHKMFEPQVASFRNTHRVICPDTRGNGNSGKLTGPVTTVLDRQCDDIESLLSNLDIEKAVFCGISYGGVFCLHFALRYPNRVAGMTISDSFGDTRIHNLQEALLMTSLYTSLWAFYVPKLLAPSLKWQYQKWPLAQKYMMDAFQNMRSHEVLLQRLAINKANHTKDLDKITFQVLGMVGDYSKIMIHYMQRMVSALPNARLEIIHGSFDPSNLCQQETYDRLLKGYLSDIKW